jgi:ABC-type branched-subunit amino acid transport system ATPase component
MNDALPILRLARVRKHFGGLNVIDDLDFSVRRGSRTALIGPNGAGKTTVFNLITGVVPVDGGHIFTNGIDITSVPSRLRIRHAIARTFQNVRLMPRLSTIENVMVGQHALNTSWFGILQPINLLLRNRWRDAARAALSDAGLGQYEYAPVGSLSYGVQKRIELVRANMAEPQLLLLDEPAAGLNPAETEALHVQLDKICQRGGVTLLVVEHDMQFVNALCEEVIVLSFGKKIAEGAPEAIRHNLLVQEVYLGAPLEHSDVAERPASDLSSREHGRAARTA